jgi:hypothetical protein
MSFLARPPHQPGSEPDAMHAHRRRQAANGQRQMDQAGSAAEDASQRRHDGDAAGLRHDVQASTKASRWPAGQDQPDGCQASRFSRLASASPYPPEAHVRLPGPFSRTRAPTLHRRRAECAPPRGWTRPRSRYGAQRRPRRRSCRDRSDSRALGSSPSAASRLRRHRSQPEVCRPYAIASARSRSGSPTSLHSIPLTGSTARSSRSSDSTPREKSIGATRL